MSWNGLFQFAGGIGLFLLGMRLMSDGLRIAAGPAILQPTTAPLDLAVQLEGVLV